MSNRYGPRIVTDGLIFNMDFASPKCYSGSGATCLDISSNSFVGEIVNNPPFSSSTNNKYFSFNGSTNSRLIRIQNSTLLDTQTPSVEVWVRTSNTTQNGFWFEKGTVNSQYSLFQEGASIQWRHQISGVGLTNLTTATATVAGLNTTNWFQVVGTYISGTRRLYVNGSLKNSDSRTGAINTNNGGMSIGVYGGYSGSRSYYYTGDIAVVRVYNRALLEDEVKQNYNALNTRFN
jgi:hypothetical protein